MLTERLRHWARELDRDQYREPFALFTGRRFGDGERTRRARRLRVSGHAQYPGTLRGRRRTRGIRRQQQRTGRGSSIPDVPILARNFRRRERKPGSHSQRKGRHRARALCHRNGRLKSGAQNRVLALVRRHYACAGSAGLGHRRRPPRVPRICRSHARLNRRNSNKHSSALLDSTRKRAGGSNRRRSFQCTG